MTRDYKGYQNLRRNRISAPGNFYHITCVTHNRVPLFNDLLNARKLIRILADDHNRETIDMMAFCIMPDHFHWLFELKVGGISHVVKRVKSKFSKATGHPAWQDGFHDHLLRSDEDLVNVARYIVANPLRAKMVTDIRDYPHWYAKWL